MHIQNSFCIYLTYIICSKTIYRKLIYIETHIYHNLRNTKSLYIRIHPIFFHPSHTQSSPLPSVYTNNWYSSICSLSLNISNPIYRYIYNPYIYRHITIFIRSFENIQIFLLFLLSRQNTDPSYYFCITFLYIYCSLYI